MRSALLLPVLLVGLCSRRGDGTSTTASTGTTSTSTSTPTSTTTASVSVTQSPTTVKPPTLAPTGTRPTDSPKPGALSTGLTSAPALTTSANNMGRISPGASPGTPPGMPSATGPTSKPPPPISTTVGSNIPAVSSPTTKPSFSTVATKGTTQAGSGSPGSAVSTSPSLPPKATVSSAAPESKTTTPGGPSTPFVVQTTKPSSKAPSTLTTKPPLSTEVLTTTMAKPLGPHGTSTAVSPGATSHILSTGPKTTARATSASSTHHAPPRPVDTGTRPAQSQIICEKEAPDKSQVVILTLNESRTCESLKNSPLEEQFLNAVCQAKMPSFNRSRDQCIMRVASSTTDPKQLPIIDVTVWINSATSQLFESLTMNKGELEKLGVVNITHNGRTEDINMEDRFSMPLIITIVCMAASLLLVAAIYGCCHQRLSQRKDQQRLTEELQTMENGYHDNPTLEVMETSSEMQEKKINLNGELGDSWIVPMDNLTREDLEEEEDTHL